MYGMVLMAAMTGTGPAAAFGDGAPAAAPVVGCYGCTGSTGCIGSGCHGHLFGHELFAHKEKHGCSGGLFSGLFTKHGCHGAPTGCCGTVVASAPPAPVVVPAPVCSEKKPSFFEKLKAKCKKPEASCCAPAPCPPAVIVPPVTEPTPTPMDMKKPAVTGKPGASD